MHPGKCQLMSDDYVCFRFSISALFVCFNPVSFCCIVCKKRWRCFALIQTLHSLTKVIPKILERGDIITSKSQRVRTTGSHSTAHHNYINLFNERLQLVSCTFLTPNEKQAQQVFHKDWKHLSLHSTNIYRWNKPTELHFTASVNYVLVRLCRTLTLVSCMKVVHVMHILPAEYFLNLHVTLKHKSWSAELSLQRILVCLWFYIGSTHNSCALQLHY